MLKETTAAEYRAFVREHVKPENDHPIEGFQLAVMQHKTDDGRVIAQAVYWRNFPPSYRIEADYEGKN